MSVVEQGSVSPTDIEIGIPEFPVALRGYDRQQVDAFVQDLTVRLTAERRRAEHTERAANQLRAELATARENQAPPSFEHLGAEAGRVLAQAGNSAKLLIEEAQLRGEGMVEAAEARAAAVIERAERRAAELEAEASDAVAHAAAERERILTDATRSVTELRGQADEEARAALESAQEAADQALQKAAAGQAAMHAETERLRESRDHMLDYLGRIHSDLGELLAEAVQADADLTAQLNGRLGPVAEGDAPEVVDEDEDHDEDEDEQDEVEVQAGSVHRED